MEEITKGNDSLDVKEPDTKKEDRQIKNFTRLSVLLIIVGFFVAFVYFVFPKENLYSNFGDYVGGVVSSLWSLAGLLIIYVAFVGQKKQIIWQQHDINLNRIEVSKSTQKLEAQKVQMELQNETMKMQQFEHAFFNLLSMMIEVGELNKRIEFSKSVIDIIAYFDISRSKNSIRHITSDVKEYMKNLKAQARSQPSYSQIGNFFSNYIAIIRFIDSRKMSAEAKYYYTSLAMEQISPEEHFLCALYFFSINESNLKPNKGEEAKKLFEKYCLLRNLMHSEYIVLIDNLKHFHTNAFYTDSHDYLK